MNIDKVSTYSHELIEAVNNLLPQLSSSAQQLNEQSLKEIINSECSHLFIASEDNQIFGMLTLIVFNIPTGTRAWVEDVVVSETARGKGVGKALISAAIDTSNKLGAKTTDLTSRPSRDAANRLYQKCGFSKRATNVYRHEN